MLITHPAEMQDRLYELLGYAHIDCGPDAITLRHGSDEYVLRRGQDDVWRLTTVTTYGNVQFVSGEGCDGTGLRITHRDLRAILTDYA